MQQPESETPEVAPLPLVSGNALLQQQSKRVREQLPQYMLRAVSNSLQALLTSNQDYVPENAVAAIFARHEAGRMIGINAALLWVEGPDEEKFISDLTSSIQLERQTGLYSWGHRLDQTKQALMDSDAPLIGLGALVGLRVAAMHSRESVGALVMIYSGDGHIVTAVVDPAVNTPTGAYPMMAPAEVDSLVLASGKSIDIRGDLGLLYSTLTASDEEYRLFG